MDIFRRPSVQVTAPAEDAPHSSFSIHSVAAEILPKNPWFISPRSPSSKGIENRAQTLAKGGVQPVIAEDERENSSNSPNGQHPNNNASTLSLSSDSAEEYRPPNESGASRLPRSRSMEILNRSSLDDGFVRVHKPSMASTVGRSGLPSVANGLPQGRSSTSNAHHRRQPSDPTNVLPLTSLYLVSGLPKSPQTWTLADNDSVAGVHHSEGAVGRWWRAEVLGSTVSPGVGGAPKKKKSKGKNSTKGGVVDSSEAKAGLAKGDLGKMLSKSLKLSFTREVEVIASTLQPASTVHTFTFTTPTSQSSVSSQGNVDFRSSVFSATSAGTIGDRTSVATMSQYNYNPYIDPTLPRPSSTYLGPPVGHNAGHANVAAATAHEKANSTTYYGVCLTVWSHADEERSTAIRRTLETAANARRRNAKVSMSSIATSIAGTSTASARPRKKSGPWSGTEAEESETDGGAMSESDVDGFSSAYGGISGNPNGAGASTLFLPQNTVFWLPYALTLVSRHPIYDLMRDYLTLSWARFSKDVQSHTLQIAKILEHPAPRAGDVVRLDAGTSGETIEVICRFPGGLDFGRGLVDVNFTMWPLFRCLNLDNILTLCEIALAPTGRILFLSRHPAMLGIAVSTLKYLVELRGWSGVALPNLHSRDAKIYLEDPGPWIIAMSTESRYCVRPGPEVCVCDLDINYVNCASPPPGAVSVKQQRDKFRRILMSAFDSYFHPDHSVPSEFKEAFPAGRFRPLCKIQSKRGSSIIAESIRAPSWWHQTRVVSAFDAVLKEKVKKPSLIKRITTLGLANKRPQDLSPAERLIQMSIRKRATAFVDARDDLETKIGRLSRRLNFLMTESELWRQKFVAFEGYAEKLSAEATELRGKIGKEQRESKRLSGLVSVTAHEKHLLQSRLAETEHKHKEAVVELDRMKEEMDEMEDERAKMVAEVEAQIERALASMALSDDNEDSDYSQMSSLSNRSGSRGPARPRTTGSYRSSSQQRRISSAPNSRPGSATGHDHSRPLRSFATATTLAGDHNAMNDDDYNEDRPDDTIVIERELEAEAAGLRARKGANSDGEGSEKQRKRFSSINRETHMDGLGEVDQGISEKSDLVAQKVLAIQAKLDNALAENRRNRTRSISSRGTRSEMGSADEQFNRPSSRARPARSHRFAEPPVPRIRTKSTASEHAEKEAALVALSQTAPKAVTPIPYSRSEKDMMLGDQLAAPPPLRKISSGVSLSATRPLSNPREGGRHDSNASAGSFSVTTPGVTMDDSDDSYMSAYSASPDDSGFLANESTDNSASDMEAYDPETMNRFRATPVNGLNGALDVDRQGLLHHDVAADFGKRSASRQSRRSARERAESTATARGKAAALEAAVVAAAEQLRRDQSSPTVSEFSTRSAMRITGTAV